MTPEEELSYAKGFVQARIGSVRPEAQDDIPAFELLLRVIERLEGEATSS